MSKPKAAIHRLRTGVPGLDEILGGGLPEFSFNIIVGSPGSGKTTLAHQIMFTQATAARPALFFTVLGEPPLKMLRYQQQFDFFDIEKVNKSIHFINLSDDTTTGDLGKVLARIVAAVEAHEPGLVFIDSFRSVALAGCDGGGGDGFIGLQAFIQRLGMLMTSWQATTFLVGEYVDASDPNPVFAVCDGFLCLTQSVLRNSVVRKIDIVKMRGQPTVPGLHTFRISAEGITVFPPVRIQEHAERVPPPATKRLCMGVPGLDDMLGGGLPCGYSLLVAGPSGSGKSTMASAFLAEGARSGETGVIAAFDQRPQLSRQRVVADLIASGRVGLVQAGGSELSVDEVTALLVAEIHRLKATRVVVDSLSGFMLKIAPTFREDYRESLARMTATLSSIGVTTLMTSELEDRYTDLRFSPFGTAFLTDAIIVQRYIEVDSRLLRVMAVVKVRASDHSNELRRYDIDAGGIKLGEMLSSYEGLLGGRPTESRDSDSGDSDVVNCGGVAGG